MSPIPPHSTPIEKNSPTADVLIVGGGINGVCLAFNLARRGIEVTLIEKDAISSGPTGRSCGIIRQHYSHEITARMALRCLRIFENFDDEVGGICDFRKTGALVTAAPGKVDVLRANVALQQSVGIDTRLISVAELAELEPDANLDGIAAGAWEPDAGYADPYATTTSYAQRAIDLGATILTGVTARSILQRKGKAIGVLTDQGPIHAGIIVLAVGPWSAAMVRACGYELPLSVGRVQVGLFRTPPALERRRILLDTVRGIYLRPESGPVMVVGSLETDEADTSIENPDSFRDSMDYETVTRYSDRLVHRYPAMVDASYVNGYASLYDISPDWQPILDRIPSIDGLYCMAGSSGHGFKLAPVVGEMMADLVTHGKTVDDDIEMFALDRFRSRQLAAGSYEQQILG